MYAEHIYDVEINENDPQYAQPPNITISLKPHQLAALHKAVVMETAGKVYYNITDPASHLYHRGYRRNVAMMSGAMNITTNIGIMGDIVGYGKTLSALSLIASVPTANIHTQRDHIQSSFGRAHFGHFTATTERNTSTISLPERFIHTTLVIVPRGPVYVQWERSIDRNTTLKKLAIESLPAMRRLLPPGGSSFEQIKTFFEQFDVVLIKNTCLKTLMDFYHQPFQEEHPLLSWDRIMVDEAHDIVCKIPLFSFKYLWMITATYQTILDRTYGTRNLLSYVARDILTDERVNLCLVKGELNFVKRSFDIPEPIERFYMCALQRDIAAIQPFLSTAIQERLNANDIAGAIRELGGSDETESSLVDLVTREIERDIANKKRELEYIRCIDIPEEQREHRVATITNELARLQDRKDSLVERISTLSQKMCPICYENFNNPIMLPCTHVFCGGCLINWMHNGKVCPECRAPIQSRQLIAIVDQKVSVPDEAGPSQIAQPKSKEDTLLDIIASKENGKFLVFTTIDAGFWSLIRKLTASGIVYAEMKGSTPHMMRVLEDFRAGRISVILLNTYYAGSGIDMSFATDVILFHAMGLERVQAIGRAQRQGRTEPLMIHNLCYPHETQAQQ